MLENDNLLALSRRREGAWEAATFSYRWYFQDVEGLGWVGIQLVQEVVQEPGTKGLFINRP